MFDINSRRIRLELDKKMIFFISYLIVKKDVRTM